MRVIVLLLLAVGAAHAGTPEGTDLFDKALDAIDRDRSDLGYRPKGYWNRFPGPDGIPHLLPFFTDLFAEPLRTYDFTRTFAAATERYLTPDYRAAHDDALRNLVYYLGVCRRMEGFRSYGANLPLPDSTDAPLLGAVREVYRQGGWITDAATFGQHVKWPETYEDVAEAIESVPGALQPMLADLLRGLADAHHWWTVAVRNVPAEMREKVFRIRALGESQPDGTVYYPEIDDTAALLDEPSLVYAALKAAASVERAKAALDSLAAEKKLRRLEDLHAEIPTPFGRLVLAGTENDAHAYTDLLCLVDLGGDDTYSGSVGATVAPWIPISVALDYCGNDSYSVRLMGSRPKALGSSAPGSCGTPGR